MIKFTVPVKVTNPLNGSQGRTRAGVLGRAAKRKKQRESARFCVVEAFAKNYVNAHPLCVGWPEEWNSHVQCVLRRVSPRALDGDGLQAALKSVRDGIADALGINDGSDAVTWRYDWRKGKPREYAVEVEIAPNQEQTREAL